MNIAVDADDVIWEFARHICECWETEYAEHIDYESLAWEDLLNGSRGPTWKWLRSRDWLWTKMPVVPGAIGGLQRLRQEGHHLEILTKKPDWAEWTVWALCGKWRPPVSRLTVVPSAARKVDYSDADLLIDDSIHNVVEWESDGRGAIVFDRPWNREHGADDLYRVRNWSEVACMVKVVEHSYKPVVRRLKTARGKAA